jgi:hypothetical protein
MTAEQAAERSALLEAHEQAINDGSRLILAAAASSHRHPSAAHSAG